MKEHHVKRVFCVDGSWYWITEDDNGNAAEQDPNGPFASAMEAGKDARKHLLSGAVNTVFSDSPGESA